MLQSKLVGGLKESDAPVVAGGSVQWILANNGDIKWPCATTLRLISGPILMSPIVDIPALDPGQTLIIDLDVPATTEPTTVFYTLITPNGQPFGEILTAKVVPENSVPRPRCAVVDSPAVALDKGMEGFQGEVKMVEWQLANVGVVAWPDDAVATLIYNSPSLENLSALIKIPAIDPGMTMHVGVSVQMPQFAGHFKVMWAVHSPTNPDFGETLHAEFDVSEFPFMEWMAPEFTENVLSSESEMQSTGASHPEETRGESADTFARSQHRQAPYKCEVPDCGKCGGMHRQKCDGALQPALKRRYMVSISNTFAHLTPEDNDVEEEEEEEEEQVVGGSRDEDEKKPHEPPVIRAKRLAKKPSKTQKAEDCDQIWAMQLEQFEKMAESERQARLKEQMDKQEEIEKQQEAEKQENTNDGEHTDNDSHSQCVERSGDEPPVHEQIDNDHQAQVAEEQEEESASLDKPNSSSFEIGSKVEVRNTDEDVWQRGTVASVGPLTVIVGDDMMAFEYQQVRRLGFEVGMKVEARNSEGQPWEQGIVASGEPLTVFLGKNAMAFEYNHVRATSRSKDSLSFSFWHFAVVALLVILHFLFGRSTTRPFVDLGLEDGKPSLIGKTWLASNTSSSQQKSTKGAVQHMVELGHLRLSMSDCVGAERWFAKALVQLKLDGSLANSMPQNRSHPSAGELGAILRDHGFALVCAQRFSEGRSALSRAGFLAGKQVSPHYVNALGYALFQSRAYDDAKQTFESIIKTHADNPVLWNNLGAASILAGDAAGAENALIRALQLSSRLKPSVKEYYMQVFSNNVHILQGTPSASGRLPWVELFNCMPETLKVLASSKDPVAFEHTFAEVAATSEEDGPLAAEQLAHSRSAVLALDPEPLFCP